MSVQGNWAGQSSKPNQIMPLGSGGAVSLSRATSYQSNGPPSLLPPAKVNIVRCSFLNNNACQVRVSARVALYCGRVRLACVCVPVAMPGRCDATILNPRPSEAHALDAPGLSAHAPDCACVCVCVCVCVRSGSNPIRSVSRRSQVQAGCVSTCTLK